MEQMDRLTCVLHTLTAPDLQLTPDQVLHLLQEAVALVQRVGMSLEASFFCLTQAKLETRKVLKVLVPLLLKHRQLFDAVYHNPSVVKLLPILMSAVMNSIGASSSSSSGNTGSASLCSDRVNDRLFDESTLLWVILSGNECAKEKSSQAFAHYLLLLDIFRVANHHPAFATQSHMLFFNLFTFNSVLQYNQVPLPISLSLFSTTLNMDASLLQPLSPPRRSSVFPLLLTHSILQHAFFYSFFFPLHDHIHFVRQEADNIVRKRVFLGKYRVPPSSTGTSVSQEWAMTSLDVMTKIPPFSVMGVSIDVGVGIGSEV